MKKTLLTLACAAVAPLAFAQTSSTTTTTQPTTGTSTTTSETTKTDTPVSSSSETTTTTTSTDGTVTTFEPGKTIVVRRTGVTDPISYTLGKTVTYVNKAGKTIEASMIKPGVPVHVYYSGPETSRTVTKVVVDQ
jgi:hypothetical protein